MRRVKALALIMTSMLILSACGSSSKVTNSTSPEGVYVSGCGYGYSQKPSSIMLTCADGGMYIENISYSAWSDSSAEGAGDFLMNDCNPDCASGSMIKTPVAISMGNPKQDSNGKTIFSELIITAKSKLYNGSNTATFDIFMQPEGDDISDPAPESQPEPMDPAQATADLLSRLNASQELWSINEAATSSFGQMSHKRLGLYAEPDYVIECNLPYSGTWLFVYSDENSAYEAFNSNYFFRTSAYSAEFMYDANTNLLVLLHTSMGGNKTCLKSAKQQLDYYATD